MSKYVTMNCAVLDDCKIPTLKKALKKVNKNYTIKSMKEATVHDNRLTDMDAIIMNGDQYRPFGFKFEHKESKLALSVAGDFWNTEFKNAEEFRDIVSRAYTQTQVEETIATQGQTILSQRTLTDGTIEIRVAV